MNKSEHRRNRPSHVDCLGLGICPLDFLFEVDKYPPAGTKINARRLTIQGGGPVPNALVGLCRLGHRVALITALGRDMPGQYGLLALQREGIDMRHVVRPAGSSGVAGGFVELGTGRRTLVFHRSVAVRPQDVVTARLPRPRIVHLDGRDLDACVKLARWARRIGAIVCFDIGSIRNDVSLIFPLIDHLVVAAEFALPYTASRSARRAIERLRLQCPGTIVVTEGVRGAIGFEQGRFVRSRAFKVPEADTTGAGDAFHAGYIYGLLHDFDLAARLEFGAAVAALSCTRVGARAGLPILSDVWRFLKGKPRRYA